MKRLLLIARREYVAYVKTVGFWLSLLITPLSMALFWGGPLLLQRAAPVAHVSVINLTGSTVLDGLIERRLADREGPGGPRGGPGAGPGADRGVAGPGRGPGPQLPGALNAAQGGRDGGPGRGGRAALVLEPPPVTITPDMDHVAIGKAVTPALAAAKRSGGLDSVLVVYRDQDDIGIDIWSRTATGNPEAENAVRDAVGDWMQGEMLQKAGIDPRLAGALEGLRPDLRRFSASGQGLDFRTARLPGLVSFGLAMALFVMVMAGAGILLNGVIEEKSSRVLEVLLTSAEPREILFGKILGAAGIAGTIVLLWAGLGVGSLGFTQPEMGAAVANLLIGRGLALYFLLYMVGGYVMFAAIFTAVGSFCETTREAQSLLGPLMMLLILPVVVMTQAIVRPDSPILSALSWVPTFTPFLMMARAASSPPLRQVLGTGVEMLATTGLVVWAAGRAFRTGALTSGKVTLSGIIAKIRHGD